MDKIFASDAMNGLRLSNKTGELHEFSGFSVAQYLTKQQAIKVIFYIYQGHNSIDSNETLFRKE